MKNLIEEYIAGRAAQAPGLYRRPLTGYAAADDEMFTRFKAVVDERHLLPADLLPGAKTVLAFFLPYKKEISLANRPGTVAARSWAEAYHFTNILIDEICQGLNSLLVRHGIKCAWLLPTYEFDNERLTAQWSHKHVAYACGLGSFGQNHLLITAKGCAGRFGTMILDVALKPDARPDITHTCAADSGCSYCRTICPEQALTPEGLNRHRCYKRCLENDRLFADLDCVEVCGKCATGPCAYIE